jgi:hypothetical protein
MNISHRHVTATKAPDTYVKLQLFSSTGQEMAHSKTSIRRAQPNPLYKELFMYQVTITVYSISINSIGLFVSSRIMK